MDQNLQSYYDNMFTMMASQGWADFMSDMEKIKATVNDLDSVNDVNQVFFRKGQLDILNLVLKRKATAERIYEDLNEKVL